MHSLPTWPEIWTFSSLSSREELQEKLFCAAVEQEVFGPEPQRGFGFWRSAIVHPSLRTQVVVIPPKVNQPIDLDLISVNPLGGKHILVVSAAFKASK